MPTGQAPLGWVELGITVTQQKLGNHSSTSHMQHDANPF